MSVDPQLLELLACPNCRAAVALSGEGGATPELVCSGCGYAYPIQDDIPIMLVDQARRPD